MATWLGSIKDGYTLGMAYIVLFSIPACITSLIVKRGKYNIAKTFINMLFFGYMAIVFSLVFFPLPSADYVFTGHHLQLIPGFNLYDTVTNPSLTSVAQLVFNVCMTIPFGAYLKYYWKLDNKKIFALSLMLTLFIELGQFTGLFFIYPGSYRCCDIDDVVLNTAGGMLGALLMTKLSFLPDLDRFNRQLTFTGNVKHA